MNGRVALSGGMNGIEMPATAQKGSVVDMAPPPASLDAQAEVWAKERIADIDYIVAKAVFSSAAVTPPYSHDRKVLSKSQRCAYKAAMPVVCFPCIVWSTLWRLVLCPFACLFAGPQHAIGGNHCTDPSDDVLCIYMDSLDAKAPPNLTVPNAYYLPQSSPVLRAAVERVFLHTLTCLRMAERGWAGRDGNVRGAFMSYRVATYMQPYAHALRQHGAFKVEEWLPLSTPFIMKLFLEEFAATIAAPGTA